MDVRDKKGQMQGKANRLAHLPVGLLQFTALRAARLLRKLQSVQNATARLILARDTVIISSRYYTNSIGYPSESASSSKWHAWFASCCPGRRLSTWPTTGVSCPTALGALCGQLTFQLVWCRENSAVMVTELLQPRDLVCETPNPAA